MTVKELRGKLDGLDDDLIVLVRNYNDWGMDDVDSIETKTVFKSEKQTYEMGNYAEEDYRYPIHTLEIKALVIL